jgi:cytochrome c oxidase cbb3-type subunit III
VTTTEPQRMPDEPPLISPAAAQIVGGIAAALVVLAALVFALSRRSEPPPAEIAADPWLARGREVYLSRCASCHGEKGRGDGPIARSVPGLPPGDLTGGRWKHGGKPEQVLAVVRDGVPETNMTGFGKYHVLGDDDIRAVTAYVFHLNGGAVPAELRAP